MPETSKDEKTVSSPPMVADSTPLDDTGRAVRPAVAEEAPAPKKRAAMRSGAAPAASITRATFTGGAGEYLTPFLQPVRDEENPEVIHEKIFQVPARDLSEEEWQELNPAERAYVREARIYTVKTDAAISEEMNG